jgi:oxygen-independent coproporphyrinogen-3 oxidase
VSMWIQTLNSKSLDEIKRWNKWDIFEALQNLEDENFNNVSVDFIIGLPHVEIWEIQCDIQTVLDKFNCIKHVSVYLLEEYYSPDKIIETKYDNITYPENWDTMWLKEEDYLEEYIWVKNTLEKNMMNRYEISNYAKPWFECEHNKAYWSHKNIYSFGLWAYGYVDKIRYRNSENFPEYYKREKIISEKNSENDIFLEKMMFFLRTSWIPNRFLSELDQNKIKLLLDEKYLKIENNTLQLENKWVLVMDYILSEII